MNKFEQAWNYLTNRQVKVKEQINEIKTELPKNKIIYNTSDKTCQVIIGEDILVGNNIDLTEDLKNQLKTGIYDVVKAILTPKVKEEDVKEEIVNLHLDAFEGNDDFEVVGTEVYFKGIKSISIPKAIVAVFIEILDRHNKGDFKLSEDREYETMKAFTLKLLANPIQESRDNLMEYVKKFNVKMSSSGNLIMFRNIVSKGNDNKGYTEFISKEFFRVKGQKKSPKNYTIYKESENYFCKPTIQGQDAFAENIGNLFDLYQNLSQVKENRFTDDYTKSYDIRLSSIYRIKEEHIDKNRKGSCGGFLHITAGKDAYNYDAFGDTKVCVLINPMNAAKMDNGFNGKIGVTEMFICCKIENESDIPDLAHFDDVYEQATLADIKASLEAKTLDKFSVTDDVTSLNYNELKLMQEFLSKRIVKI